MAGDLLEHLPELLAPVKSPAFFCRPRIYVVLLPAQKVILSMATPEHVEVTPPASILFGSHDAALTCTEWPTFAALTGVAFKEGAKLLKDAPQTRGVTSAM